MAYVDRKSLRMSDDEVVQYLSERKWGRLASVNAEHEPHVAPIGYLSIGTDVYFHALIKSRRGRDIAAGSRLALCVDDGVAKGEGYSERTGVVVYGLGRLIDPSDSPDAESLNRLRGMFAAKFFGDVATDFERRTHGWYELKVDRHVSWDFSKIPEGADRYPGAK